MAHYYLTSWEWADLRGEFGWRPPGPWIGGALDLRPIPLQAQRGGIPGYGIFAYSTPQTFPDSVDLGEDLDARLSGAARAALAARLGYTIPAGATARTVIWDALTTEADPTGQTRAKPLRGRMGRSVRAVVGRTIIREEPFDAAHRARAVAVFQADYRAARTQGRRAITLRKWTGATMQHLWREQSEARAAELLPTEYRGDGWEAPQTTFTETWPTNSSTISTGQDQPWNEDSGDAQVASNRLTAVDTGVLVGRCTTDLSSDDHKHTATGNIIEAAATRLVTLGVRKIDSTTNTMYVVDVYRRTSGGGVYGRRIGKIVSGTFTELDGDSTDVGDGDFTAWAQADGSAITGQVQATGYSATDTAITGNLQIGYRLLVGSGGSAGDVALDDHTAADIVSGFTLAADGTSYVWTGQTASPAFNRAVVATTGSYVWTGQIASLVFDRVTSAEVGSYAWTGQAITPTFDRVVPADAALYVWTGQDAGLVFDRVLTATTTSYAWTGQDVTLSKGFTVVSEAASYTWTGQSVDLVLDRVLTALGGAYTWSGQDVALALHRILTSKATSYAWTGASTTLIYGIAIAANSGSYTWTGSDVGLAFNRVFSVDGATFTWTPTDVTLTHTIIANIGILRFTNEAFSVAQFADETFAKAQMTSEAFTASQLANEDFDG